MVPMYYTKILEYPPLGFQSTKLRKMKMKTEQKNIFYFSEQSDLEKNWLKPAVWKGYQSKKQRGINVKESWG